MAVSDPLGMVATPLRVADVKSDADAVAAACEAIRDTEAEKVVVGLPLNMDGTSGPKAEQVMAFCEKLKAQSPVPIDTWDERLSSRIAERAMLEADLSRKKRKGLRDKLAAQVILQGYLDAQANALDLL
jgi:putative Holliday junction resolvase